MRAPLISAALVLGLGAATASYASAGDVPFDPATAARKAGPPRAQAAPPALKLFVDKMARLWSFDCAFPGNRDAVVPIRFVIGPDGRFTDGPTIVGAASPPDEHSAAAAAVRALKGGEPYSADEVAPGYRKQKITINFRTKYACSARQPAESSPSSVPRKP